MINFVPGSIASPSESTRPKLTLQAACARLALLDPEIEPGSAFDAALILMVASRIGQNIDRIARFTNIPREQVARRARRLVDNGVWCNGVTVSRWCDSLDDVEAFRSDIAVAEGMLCRRINEEGEMEWAPQGYWRKHFEYAAPKAVDLPQVVCYHPHVEMPDPEIPAPAEVDEEEALAEAQHMDRVTSRSEPTPSSPDGWLGTADFLPAPPENWAPGVDTAPPELFPGTAWLR